MVALQIDNEVMSGPLAVQTVVTEVVASSLEVSRAHEKESKWQAGILARHAAGSSVCARTGCSPPCPAAEAVA